jgi:hypothetical protein
MTTPERRLFPSTFETRPCPSVTYLGPAGNAEFQDRILNDAIRIRNALVLPEVFQPGRHHERFQESSALSCVFEDIPGIRAVAPSL